MNVASQDQRMTVGNAYAAKRIRASFAMNVANQDHKVRGIRLIDCAVTIAVT